jgi:hypothetical protein
VEVLLAILTGDDFAGRSHIENLVYDLFPTMKRPKLYFPEDLEDRKSLTPQGPDDSSIDDNFRVFLADFVTHFPKDVRRVGICEANMLFLSSMFSDGL